MVVGTSVTVATTATALGAVTTGSGKRSFCVQNPSTTVTVYIGGSDVTSTVYGYALAPGASISIDLDRGETLYAAVAASTQIVRVLSAGNL